MRLLVFLCFLALFFASCSCIGVTFKYYSDRTCDNRLEAERSFQQGECADFHYNEHRSSSSCALAVECFSERFEDDLDSCPSVHSVNATTILTGVTSVRVLTSNHECGASSIVETEELDFGECYESSIYPNCYFAVQLGSLPTIDYMPDDDDDEGSSGSARLHFSFVLATVLLVLLCTV